MKEYNHTKQDIDFLIETASGYAHDTEIYTDYIKDILLIMNAKIHGNESWATVTRQYTRGSRG